MLKTVSQRLKELRIYLDVDQRGLADKLGLKQPSVNAWEKGGNLRQSSLDLFKEKLGVNPQWLLFGTGEMFLPGYGEVNEPKVAYLKIDKWNESSVTERLSKVVGDYMVRFGMKQKQVSEEWQIGESHLSEVLNGYKPISTNMLTSALRYGNVNLNYVLGGIGGFYNGLESSNSTDVKELIELVKEQGKMIEQLQNTPRKKERA